MDMRTSRISASIAGAIVALDHPVENKGILDGAVKALASFFSLYRLGMARYRPSDFLQLRRDFWEIDEDEYRDSFHVSACPDAASPRLVPAGDLGYSGSTFFTTPNGMYLVKSLPRRFEHQFFTHDLLDSYAAHMMGCPGSLLVRIVDMVYTPRVTLGGLLGTAPTHHVAMENLLYRAAAGQQQTGVETYDLKPDDYFFPERDIADGRLAPDSVKDGLVDTFPGKVQVSAEARDELLSLLDADTALLAASSAVDYSLFVVRFARLNPDSSSGPDMVSPFADSSHAGGSWRTGVVSTDGRWTYRAVVLDFFWAKKKLRAKVMTGLVNAFNLLANRGPMSITAQPAEYRTRFMAMVDKLVVANDVDDNPSEPDELGDGVGSKTRAQPREALGGVEGSQ